MEQLMSELKESIIQHLKLQDVKKENIDNDAPLFGAGLGLDSIDALELIVLLQQEYGIKIKNAEEGKSVFQSVRTMADFVTKNRVN